MACRAFLYLRRGTSPLAAAPEQASFTPYAYRYGVYNGGNWPKYQQVLEKDWLVYLDGKTSFQTAIHSMVADLR